MPKLLDSATQQGVLLQSGTGAAIISNSLILMRVTGIPETNIRRLAYVYVYRNLIASEAGDFFSVIEFQLRQPRSGFNVPNPYPVGTIIRVVPLYDYTRFELWYNV